MTESAKDRQRNAWRALLFTGLGLVIGAGLDFVVRSDLGRREILRQSRREDYVSFIQADKDGNDAGRATAATRIAMYGSREVAESLASYWRNHFPRRLCPASPEKIKEDVAIYHSMRIESGLDRLSDDDMMMLLFRCCVTDTDEKCPVRMGPFDELAMSGMDWTRAYQGRQFDVLAGLLDETAVLTLEDESFRGREAILNRLREVAYPWPRLAVDVEKVESDGATGTRAGVWRLDPNRTLLLSFHESWGRDSEHWRLTKLELRSISGATRSSREPLD